jgi:hypothetical protein
MRSDPEIYVLTLQAQDHEVPAILRLRALLKRALRDYGLRCISVVRDLRRYTTSTKE